MATVNFYSKEQIDEKIPDTAGASQGDVLTIGASGTEWATPSGGMTAHTYTTVGEFSADYIAHPNAILRPNDIFDITNPSNAGNLNILLSRVVYRDSNKNSYDIITHMITATGNSYRLVYLSGNLDVASTATSITMYGYYWYTGGSGSEGPKTFNISDYALWY